MSSPSFQTFRDFARPFVLGDRQEDEICHTVAEIDGRSNGSHSSRNIGELIGGYIGRPEFAQLRVYVTPSRDLFNE